MNEQVSELLKKLSESLGTTTEKLWGVLIKQAPIEGISDTFCSGMLFIGLFVWWKIFLRKTSRNEEGKAEWENETAFGAIMFTVLYTLFSFILFSGNISIILAAFFNPEYWALQKVLSYFH